MTRVIMPRSTFKGVEIPGGWEIDVPTIEVYPSHPRFLKLVQTLMKFGKRPLGAHEAALQACEDFWTREWRARTLKIVGHWAKIYADRNHGSLEGFEPERIAELWIPGMRIFGNPAMDLVMLEMRRKKDVV